jgi:hypothetical protein
MLKEEEIFSHFPHLAISPLSHHHPITIPPPSHSRDAESRIAGSVCINCDTIYAYR